LVRQGKWDPLHDALITFPEPAHPIASPRPFDGYIEDAVGHLTPSYPTDFFCKSVLTPLGGKTAYCLIFMHLGSRRVFLSPATLEHKQAWVVQQARNVSMWMQDQGIQARFVLCDHDAKFPASFDATFAAAGAKVLRTPTGAPNANAFVESWIGKLRRECLDHLWCFGLGHLDHIVEAYAAYHNHHRPHQSLGNLPLPMQGKPLPVLPLEGTIHCRQFLGGLLKHYDRAAA
jgi:putative transposase